MSTDASVHMKEASQEDDMAALAAKSCTPIAIVGIGFRGPADAKNVQKLWEMIMAGREAWSPIPAERWNNVAFYHPDNARHGTINVEGGHFLEEDVSLFDAPFFNMTSDEAAAMDPQQRLLLEVAYEGLENAGIPLANIMGTKTSCFVGSFSADYTDLLLRDPECVPMYQCTNSGQSRAMVANRLSYFFDLKGPSVTVDTACSGSLVALHLACQSLQTGDASMAIAAGVNLILSHEFMSTMSMMKFLSPDGRCHTFDEKANGYARGEAVGCLILKPLSQALHDGNTIRAVIRGTGSNQDGRTAGIAMPNRVAQETLIRGVYARAGLDPLNTDFVEAHGTGTQAGDPIETGAISQVFGAGRSPDKPVRIGSIKTNLGHLEGASGVAGVIKAVLMLENRMFLPNRNFEKINPRILLEDWNLKIQLCPEPWETTGFRRVSVNSFGYGGSNAHVIIEEVQGSLTNVDHRKRDWNPLAVSKSASEESPGFPRIYLLSGFDEVSCAQQMQALCTYILEKGTQNINEGFLDNLAFTINERRSVFPWKVAVVCGNAKDLAGSLSQNIKARSAIRKPRLGFVFTGQGAQWAGMGKELLPIFPAFKASVLAIDRHLNDIGSGITVQEEIQRSPKNSNLNHPSLSQTVCTALQIALVDLLSSWNIYPDSVTGHSSGEIAAAYASGALSMKDAISVAYYRGLLASQLLDDPIGGAMMAVGMSIKDIQPYLDRFDPGELVVACVNSPSSVTISGDALAVDALGQMLKDQPVFSRRLEVGVAYHSPHMEKIAEQYHDLTDHIQVLQPAGIEANGSQHPVPRFFSSVTGTLFSPDRLNNDYWVSNLLGQVKFADSLRTLCFETGGQCAGQQRSPKMKRVKAAQKASVDCLVEIGPHSALNGPIQQIIRADAKLNSADIAYISILTRKTDAVSTSMGAAATLVSLNYPVNFEEINRPEVRRKEHTPELLMDLPAYSWNHTRSYWAEPRLSRMYRNRPTPRLDLIGAPDNMSCPFEPRWRNHLRTSELPWLLDHKIQGSIIFPAAGYLTIAIEAAKQLMETREDIHTYLLQEIKIKSALVLNETSAVELMVSLSKSSQDRGNLLDFHIYSISENNNWTEHCTGLVGGQKHPSSSKDGAEEAGGYAMVPLGTEVHGISVIDVQSFYDKLQNAGLEYGPCFSNLTEARVTQDGTCFAELTAPDTRSMMPASFQHDLLIHPCTLDSIFHTVLAALPPGMGVEEGPVIPVSIEEMIISSGLNFLAGELMSVCTHVRRMPKKDVTACIVVADCNDKKFETEPSLSIRGLQCARLGLPETASTSKAMSAIYNIDWKADSSFLTGDNASFLFDRSDHEKESLLQTESEHYAADFIRAALEEVGPEEAMTLDSSHRRFWCYLQDVLERYDTESKPHFEEFDAAPVGHLLQSIGQNLVGIIQDRIDYSSVIQDDHSLDAFWDIFSTDASYQAVANYVALLGHKKPTLSILEFGVGTGQIAEIFLQALMKIDGPSCCAKYIFVHESASVLEQTSTQLEPWSDCVACKALYLDKSFTEQGFENNSFDVIILPHGLCTARSEQIALSNIHDLLYPSGCLITINPFDPKRNVLKNLLFSALHCLSADEFCLGQGGWTENQWTETLSDAQFTSVDAFAEQNSEKSHHFIVAKKQSYELSKAKISIISEDKDGNATKYLVSQFKKASCDVIVTDIHNVHPKDRICLILDVWRSSILVAPDSTELMKIKEIFMGSAGVLWVTKGGTIEPVNPDASLAFGFARTARAESGVKPIITLDLDARNPLSDARAAEVISGLLVARFLRGEPDDDTEYAERNGVMLIPRVLEDMNANKTIESIDNIENVSAHYFQHIDQPVRLSRKTNKPGFVSDIQMSELPMDYVGIKVHSFGLTRWDSSQDLRYWEMDDTLGLECSGVVYKVGAGVHDITIGDRVACLGTGTARSFYHDRLSAFQIIRDDMTLELASAIPLAYTTAYYAVNYLALIEVEELVLVHNAGSLFGQAIMDVCLLKQARVFAIVQKTTERDSLVAQYNIPGEHILGSGQVEFVKSLLRFTDGKKANTVFAFDDAEENELKSCTAPFGRLIQLRTDFLKTRRLSCPQNMSLSILNIFELYKERADLADQIWSKVARLFLQNRLKGPASINLYPVSHIHEAITTASAEQHAVVSAKPDDIVQATLPKNPQPLFRNNVSYLLVGGLGGIGREIALWMAQNGAKSLIFINRSGLSTDQSKRTVKELMERGIQVTIKACDISDETHVERILHNLSNCTPPIRGLIQSAMVLRDVHIEDMQLDDYRDVMGPKHRGTWNLHRHLPNDMDFFVMLSSISGVIGNATQAAYAAGCAFMDSFAAYRNNQGLPAVSIDLGVITDAGYLAENKELATRMERQGFHGTNTTTLLSLIQVAISQPSNDITQMVTGLGQWREGESLGNFDVPLFSHFRRKFVNHAATSVLSNSVEALKVELSAAKTIEQASIVIGDAIGRKLASHLSIPIENINPLNPVSEYGVDSHVAIELRNWISRSMGCTIPILEILARSLMDLSHRVASDIIKDEEE